MAESFRAKRPLKIFIAEDHVAIREVLVAYFRTTPQLKIIGQAGNGREAVSECLRLKPDVLLLDVDLPEMSGIAVTSKVTSELPETRILIFTSHNDAATVRQVLEAGAHGIIEKSGSVESLIKAIETVGDGRAYFGESVTQVLQRSFTESVSARTEDNLTTREREVLQLIAEGCSNKEVSSRLGISVKTAENHRHNIMRKFGAHNAADLTREAYRLGLLKSGIPSKPDA